MKKRLYWLVAILMTVVISVYQRMTGPTHPKRVKIEMNGEFYQTKLPRSGVQEDELVRLKGLPAEAKAEIHYRRYPTDDPYTTADISWIEGEWQAVLPVQPVAGKLQYYITVNGQDYPASEPLVIRFRNDVPVGIILPHVLFMFAAMLFAIYTFLLVVTGQAYQKWLKITVVTLFIGGFMLGPLMQHVAFGPWWTGFPFGTDLTDNKTLISFLFFLGALASMRWKHNRWVVALAVLIMVVIFSIPHSTNGSEYNYTTQTIGTEK